ARFRTAASLRQHLQAAVGVSPSAYRSTFRGAGADPARLAPAGVTEVGAGR
ncbi:AraC family transcriptional regulator, partial [Streptomyces rimosus]